MNLIQSNSINMSVRWWIEKTYLRGRRTFGQALRSPQKGLDGRKVPAYENMKEVKKGDIVVHLVNNRAIIGISVVDKEYKTTSYKDNKGVRPGYSVTLRGYQKLEPSIDRSEILNSKNREKLLTIIEKADHVFFNKNLNLNEGAYLTEAPLPLVQIINNIYREKSGKNLPHFQPSSKQEISLSPAAEKFIQKFKMDSETQLWLNRKEKVFKKWREKFAPENIHKLSEEEFRSFLGFKGNQSWDGIHRHKTVYQDMDKLIKTLKYLGQGLNESDFEEIRHKLDDILSPDGPFKIKGLARAIITPVMHILDEKNRLGVWNKKVDDAFEKLNLSVSRSTKSIGEKYLEYNSLLNRLGSKYGLNLRQVDILMHKIVTEFEPNIIIQEADFLVRPSEEEIRKAIAKIQEKLLINETSIREIINHLISGKNVIICGPIGTGKTHLATLIPKYVWASSGGYYPLLYTATADWTTQDVIGGIVPKLDPDNRIVYRIHKGCAYESVLKNLKRENNSYRRCSYLSSDATFKGVWLVIDEFNRANIDRAFGEMFTAIEYSKLKVPTIQEGKTFEELFIPNDFRIIGTLNTFDKHYLFKLSDALKRRFAFVEILPPDRKKAETEKYYAVKRCLESLSSVIEQEKLTEIRATLNHEKQVIENKDEMSPLLRTLNAAYDILSFIRMSKNLGTATLIAIYSYVLVDRQTEEKDFDKSLDVALKSLVMPHLESIQRWSLESIRAFCDGNIISFFKSKKDTDYNFPKYAEEFVKLLEYLEKDDLYKKVERYKTGDIGEEKEWMSYNPWIGKTRPHLPLFEKALNELIKELQLI